MAFQTQQRRRAAGAATRCARRRGTKSREQKGLHRRLSPEASTQRFAGAVAPAMPPNLQASYEYDGLDASASAAEYSPGSSSYSQSPSSFASRPSYSQGSDTPQSSAREHPIGDDDSGSNYLFIRADALSGYSSRSSAAPTPRDADAVSGRSLVAAPFLAWLRCSVVLVCSGWRLRLACRCARRPTAARPRPAVPRDARRRSPPPLPPQAAPAMDERGRRKLIALGLRRPCHEPAVEGDRRAAERAE